LANQPAGSKSQDWPHKLPKDSAVINNEGMSILCPGISTNLQSIATTATENCLAFGSCNRMQTSIANYELRRNDFQNISKQLPMNVNGATDSPPISSH
jgi:hypothetical protein